MQEKNCPEPENTLQNVELLNLCDRCSEDSMNTSRSSHAARHPIQSDVLRPDECPFRDGHWSGRQIFQRLIDKLTVDLCSCKNREIH